jgi:hypothetical protein
VDKHVRLWKSGYAQRSTAREDTDASSEKSLAARVDATDCTNGRGKLQAVFFTAAFCALPFPPSDVFSGPRYRTVQIDYCTDWLLA